MVNSVTYFALIFKLAETWGGVFDISIHTYGLDHFGGFRKMNINFFLGGGGGGYEEIVDIFGWSLHKKFLYILGLFSCFLKQGTERIYFFWGGGGVGFIQF